jgi:hypothetical protein
MPIFSIEQREQWQTLVTYSIEADTQDQAQELASTATQSYEEHEILNRECVRVVNIDEARLH